MIRTLVSTAALLAAAVCLSACGSTTPTERSVSSIETGGGTVASAPDEGMLDGAAGGAAGPATNRDPIAVHNPTWY